MTLTLALPSMSDSFKIEERYINFKIKVFLKRAITGMLQPFSTLLLENKNQERTFFFFFFLIRSHVYEQ